MNWFGGVMNGNNTAFELQTEFASAGTSQTLRKSIDDDTILYINYPYCVGKCRYCIYHIDNFSKEKSDKFLEC